MLERLEEGRTEVVFATASGPLTVRRQEDAYEIDLPVRTVTPEPPSAALTAALGVEPLETATDGSNHLALPGSADAVRALRPDLAAVAALERTGVVVLRPGQGIDEDPATGGAHCALVPFWAARTGRTTFWAQQASRRGAEPACRLAGDRVVLGGSCVPYLEGHVVV